MNTSKKILIIVAGLFVVLLVTTLVAFRISLQKVVDEYGRAHQYIEVTVGEFDQLEISGLWDVLVRQGRVPKLELAASQHDHSKPLVRHVGGILTFDSLLNPTDSMYVARITMQKLKNLKVAKGATVILEGFESDSIIISLSDSTSFTGRNNTFLYQKINTRGDVSLEFTGDIYE